MNMAVDKSQPKVFYDHESTYQRERCGLYKTSYDPYTLQHALNKKETSGGVLFDISDCHQDALNLPVDLNQDMAEAMRWGRTMGGPPGSVPKLHGQPSQYEAVEPFNRHKSLQKAQLQPHADTADVRTQEAGVVLTESSHGEIYNTEKFLQEHSLAAHARNEPLILMSHDNHDLNKVRMSSQPRSRKSVSFANDGRPVASCREPEHSLHRANTLPLQPIPQPSGNGVPVYALRSRASTSVELPVRLEKDRRSTPSKVDKKYGRFGVSDQFASKSSNFTAPSGVGVSWGNQTSYQALHPGTISAPLDLTYKNDDFFNWNAGSGKARPQTILLDIQNSWSKSRARKKFHVQFPETNPDLRENIIKGRQHEFMDVNAQVLRGTPIDAY